MEKEKVALPSRVKRVKLLLLTFAVVMLSVRHARGDDDLNSLELFNGGDAEVVSGSRSPRPASQSAENITVMTTDEIAALNPHNLADVLYAVTGVELEMNRTPGTMTSIEVQGANFNHVLVLIDNVPLNNLTDNYPDIASIPVQMVERIELVKGAASSSWGSALGGVINVITKSPRQERPFEGMLSGSWGTRETVDGRAEGSGSVNRFGYYLTVGKLRSDGLLPNNQSDLKSGYGKLHYELPVRGDLTWSALFTTNKAGQVAVQGLDLDSHDRKLVSSLALRFPIDNRLTLDASLRIRRSTSQIFMAGVVSRTTMGDDDSKGGSVKLTWQGDWQLMVAGVDYDHAQVVMRGGLLSGAGEGSEEADRLGVYLNDTFTVGAFAITPSARYDRTGFGQDHFSPSFGITYAVNDNTVLRGYTARGYSLTSLSRSEAAEKVWTSQVGVESGEVPYLWLKGTFFRNDTWDITSNLHGSLVKQRQLKRGGELEMRTVPLFNTALSVGYTFIDADQADGNHLGAGPRHTLKLGVHYRDPDGLRGELVGHYIDWRSPTGRSTGVLWDLHLSKTFEYSEYGSVELYGSLRNIFDGRQYLTAIYRNTGRWAEAGVRCRF